MSPHRKFHGTADHNNFQEALNRAVAAAQASEHGSDIITKWRLDAVTGEAGGIAGLQKITVEIEKV
jgi:hypothetical protein